MKKFNRFQYSAFIICCLPFIASIVAYFTKDYRYTEHRNIYLIGITAVYLFWGTSLLWGLVNSIFIWTSESMKFINKIFWIFMSLLPILIIAIFSLIVLIMSPYLPASASVPLVPIPI
jgi:polyferredoxin